MTEKKWCYSMTVLLSALLSNCFRFSKQGKCSRRSKLIRSDVCEAATDMYHLPVSDQHQSCGRSRQSEGAVFFLLYFFCKLSEKSQLFEVTKTVI